MKFLKLKLSLYCVLNKAMAHQILSNLETSLSSTVKDIQKIKQTLDQKKEEKARCIEGNSIWECHFSEDFQRNYYYNVETGESRWDTPSNATIVHCDTGQVEGGDVDDSEIQPIGVNDYYSQESEQNPQQYLSPHNAGLFANPANDVQYQGYRFDSDPQSTDYSSPMEVAMAGLNLSSPSEFNSNRSNINTGSSPSRLNSASAATKKKTIAERSAEMLQSKKEKEDNMRQYLEQQKLQQVKSTPSITTKSKHMNRKVDDMLQWDETRKAKLEAMKQMQDKQLEKQLTGKPQVKSTATLSTNSAPVHERLLEYEEQRRLKQQYLQEKADEEARLNAVPRISSSSSVSGTAQGRRDHSSAVPVQERLFNIAKQRQFDDSEVGNFDEKGTPIIHDPHTGQRLFQPKINKVSEKIVNKGRPKVAIEDLLYYKQQEYEQRAKTRELKKELQEQMQRETPKMSANSEKILSEKQQYGLLDHNIHRPIGAVKQKVLDTIEKPTFKPTISKKSKEMVSNSMHTYGYKPAYQNNDSGSVGASHRSSGFYNSNSRKGEQVFYAASLVDEDSPYSSKSRVYGDDDAESYYSENGGYYEGGKERETGYYENEDIDDATISLAQLASDEYSHPGPTNNGDRRRSSQQQNRNYMQYEMPYNQQDTSNNYNENEESFRYQQHGLSDDPGFYARSIKWQQEKEERLRRVRRQKDEEDMADCSFKPKLDESAAFAGQMVSKGGNNQVEQGSIADRQRAWFEKREQKLELERKKREEESLKECSFVPKVKVGAGGSARSNSSGRTRPATSSSVSAPNDTRTNTSASASTRRDGQFKASELSNSFDSRNSYSSNASDQSAQDIPLKKEFSFRTYAVANDQTSYIGQAYDDWGLETDSKLGKIKVPIRPAPSAVGKSSSSVSTIAAEEARLTQQYSAAAARLKDSETALMSPPPPPPAVPPSPTTSTIYGSYRRYSPVF